MSIVVSFVRTGEALGSPVQAVSRVRAMEVLSAGDTTTITAEAGEYAIIANGEADIVTVARGSTPDATATAETADTSAGIPIASSMIGPPLLLKSGDKINVAALS